MLIRDDSFVSNAQLDNKIPLMYIVFRMKRNLINGNWRNIRRYLALTSPSLHYFLIARRGSIQLRRQIIRKNYNGTRWRSMSGHIRNISGMRWGRCEKWRLLCSSGLRKCRARKRINSRRCIWGFFSMGNRDMLKLIKQIINRFIRWARNL